MFKMDLGTALAFVSLVVFPPLLECTTTCQQVGNQNDYFDGQCPVKVTSVLDDRGEYSEHVTVRVWMKADDFCKGPKIEILSENYRTITPSMRRRRDKCNSNPGEKIKCKRGVAQQLSHSNTSFPLWELKDDYIYAKAGNIVSVKYSTTTTNCTVNYTVEDPIPEFDLSVNESSKSINITVRGEYKVYTRWCYQKHGGCTSPSSQINHIDPSQSPSASLHIPHLLPCVCVQVYYTYRDARRHIKCPFEKERLMDVRDALSSYDVTPFVSSLSWRSMCPASDLKISASLCWKQHEHLCTPVLNSTLEEEEDGADLIYNTSTVDRHPQMCVQFSLQGRHNISCPFQADMSSLEVYIGPGKQSVLVYLTSSVPAMYSAQLCVLNETGCSPIGQVHTLRMEGKAGEISVNVPPHFLPEKPCVQVWQSDPALHGRRILCPDYTHNRCGIYATAAFILVVIIVSLGTFIHRLTKSGAAGWLCIQRPVLLVCSTEQSAHVSAVCALASILQGELSATVHMALWAQSSQKQAGAGTGAGVADLGPLPWLYGQWETVSKAQGKVLIVWSPEAKTAYEKWKEKRENVEKNEGKKEDGSRAGVRHEKISVDVEEDYKLNGRRLGKCKKEKAAGRKEHVKLCGDKDWYPQEEPSSVITPVFSAALACLQGKLQQCKGQGVAIVYFQGLGHTRDIPKDLRSVPRYCLPQDFRGLIQELGGMKRRTKTGKFRWYCWPRILSKVQSVWLARQLACRLQTQLPQTQGKKMQGQRVTSSQKIISDRTQSRLPPAAKEQEQEPLNGSPWRAERI
ncbi:interleukin-17 receptor E-like isoform X3 [Lates japonicus]